MDRLKSLLFKSNKLYLHLPIITLILFLSFAFNFFGVGSNEWFTNYQIDSDSLVLNSLACTTDPEHSSSWLLGQGSIVKDVRNPQCDAQFTPYYSQIGIQGKLINGIYKLVFQPIGASISAYVLLVKVFLALLSAITFTYFCYWVFSRFGVLEAYIVGFLIANSVWIVGFSKSFYWCLPLIFLPFILLLNNLHKTNSKTQNFLLLGIVFFSLILKFANGYEYATTILISMVAAIMVVGIIEKIPKPKILKLIFAVSMVGILSFGISISTHIFLIKKDVGSYSSATSILKERILTRTSDGSNNKKYVYVGFSSTTPEIRRISNYYLPLEDYADSVPTVQTEGISILNYAFLPMLSSPIGLKPIFENYVLSFFALIVLFVALSYSEVKKWFTKKKFSDSTRREVGLAAGMVVGLIGVLSWYVLAHGHSYVHAHINGITMYLPFGLLMYALIAYKVSPYLRNIMQKLSNI